MNVYKIIIGLLLSSLTFLLFSCSKDGAKTITAELNYENFNTINVKDFANVTINYGTTQQVVFKGSENYFSNITNKTENGKLFIQNDIPFSEDVKAEYIITIPKVKTLIIDGQSTVIIHDFEQKDDLSIEVNGEGAVKVHKMNNIENLNIDVEGFAVIEMLENWDALENLDINVEGNLEYLGYLLQTQNSNINYSGSGSIKIWVKKILNVKINGFGKIYYKGFPIINGKEATNSTLGIIDQN